jgi:hypothetical protein
LIAVKGAGVLGAVPGDRIAPRQNLEMEANGDRKELWADPEL